MQYMLSHDSIYCTTNSQKNVVIFKIFSFYLSSTAVKRVHQWNLFNCEQKKACVCTKWREKKWENMPGTSCSRFLAFFFIRWSTRKRLRLAIGPWWWRLGRRRRSTWIGRRRGRRSPRRTQASRQRCPRSWWLMSRLRRRVTLNCPLWHCLYNLNMIVFSANWTLLPLSEYFMLPPSLHNNWRFFSANWR